MALNPKSKTWFPLDTYVHLKFHVQWQIIVLYPQSNLGLLSEQEQGMEEILLNHYFIF